MKGTQALKNLIRSPDTVINKCEELKARDDKQVQAILKQQQFLDTRQRRT